MMIYDRIDTEKKIGSLNKVLNDEIFLERRENVIQDREDKGDKI